MKKHSIREQYTSSILANIFLLICGFGCLAVLLAFPDRVESKVSRVIFCAGMIIAFVVFIFLGIKSLANLLKDLKSVKNNHFISVVGKVIGYKKNIDGETGKQINTYPIVKILDTEETIVLYTVDQPKVGYIYEFRYLEHSKIAEIVEAQKKP